MSALWVFVETLNAREENAARIRKATLAVALCMLATCILGGNAYSKDRFDRSNCTDSPDFNSGGICFGVRRRPARLVRNCWIEKEMTSRSVCDRCASARREVTTSSVIFAT